MKAATLALALATLAAVARPAAAQGQAPSPAADPAPPFDTEGYRSARYRAPVDRLPTPAARIAIDRALRLKPGVDALFIDVLPAEGGVRDAVSGQWTLALPHETIPGAAWHPETGRSHPDDALWRGLREAVALHRANHPAVPVVLFCRSDCWMGWNAARRLAREGFGNVYWLAEGIEGWHEAGRALAPARPVIVAP
ncbi:MAG: rhodanese-like domain-containing protein [Novosphingobium sp.]|nr:rhodanese-like domain-containing protein [Novosphingobium sp.]